MNCRAPWEDCKKEALNDSWPFLCYKHFRRFHNENVFLWHKRQDKKPIEDWYKNGWSLEQDAELKKKNEIMNAQRTSD